MRIVQRTPGQRARIPEFVEKWTCIGLATGALDREQAETTLRRLYQVAGLSDPQILWLPCPLSAMLSAVTYAAIAITRPADDRGVGDLVHRILGSTLAMTDGAGMHRRIGDPVETAVGAALRRRDRAASITDVVRAIDTAHRSALEARLNACLSKPIRKLLRKVLVEPINAGIRVPVGTMLHPRLNAIPGDLASLGVLLSGWICYGAPAWAGFAGEVDYANAVLSVPLDRSFIDTLECCGLYWPLDGICFASDRPLFLNRDTEGELHCEVGPSVAYSSGWNWWHWHGQAVPQNLIESPATITVKRIDAERRPELRRVMLERYREGEPIHGAAAFLRDAGATCLDHEDAVGSLWRRDLSDDEPIVMVEVVNRTPEPDLSYRRYLLRVHPGLAPLLQNGSFGEPQPLTARNAIASTFGSTERNTLQALKHKRVAPV